MLSTHAGFPEYLQPLGLIDSTDGDLKKGMAGHKLPGQIKQENKRSPGEEGSSKTGFRRQLSE